MMMQKHHLCRGKYNRPCHCIRFRQLIPVCPKQSFPSGLHCNILSGQHIFLCSPEVPLPFPASPLWRNFPSMAYGVCNMPRLCLEEYNLPVCRVHPSCLQIPGQSHCRTPPYQPLQGRQIQVRQVLI